MHVYVTSLGHWVFEPEQFEAHMTEAAKAAGAKAFGDMRFKVAKAIKEWAAEQDKLWLAGAL